MLCHSNFQLHGYNFVYGIHVKLMMDTDKHVIQQDKY